MSYIKQYLEKAEEIITVVGKQEETIQKVAQLFAQSILHGRMVHLFGSGHSRIMVEEMWPRYGSFPGFNPIVELSLSFHNLVVGSNGQRQAMFLENVSVKSDAEPAPLLGSMWLGLVGSLSHIILDAIC